MTTIEMEEVQELNSIQGREEQSVQTTGGHKQKFKKYMSYLKYILTILIIIILVISIFRQPQQGGNTEALVRVLYKVL